MFVVYSEILWLGACVLTLGTAAVVGLWTRENPDEYESAKPLLLSSEHRALLMQEKNSTIQKAFEARKAAKKAVKASRRGLVKSQRAATTTDVTT